MYKIKSSAYLPKTIRCIMPCLSHKFLHLEVQVFGTIASQKTKKKLIKNNGTKIQLRIFFSKKILTFQIIYVKKLKCV